MAIDAIVARHGRLDCLVNNAAGNFISRTEDLRGVWGSGPRDVFAVGAGGVIMRYDGVRWYLMFSPTRKELRSVWGTGPTDVYAVGEDGIVLRFDGAHWMVRDAPVQDLLLSIQGEPGRPLLITGSRGVVLEGVR